jgi:hypothetical protein
MSNTNKNGKSELLKIRFPHELAAKIREKENYSAYVRQAVIEKLTREKHKAA